jgi:hypothetical protein
VSYMIDNVAIIIRTCGERTYETCYHMAQSQVPTQNIMVLRETPHHRAVKKTFEIGVEKALEWTLALDADLLLTSTAISDLMRIAESESENTFEIQGRILDKLFGGVRSGGPHLYRTKLLRVALELGTAPDTEIRPDNYMIHRMKYAGYPFVQDEVILALHDYAQFYSDICRKCIAHSRKHETYIPYLGKLWKRLANNDPDYAVAWYCITSDFLNSQNIVSTDARTFLPASEFIKYLNMQEKPMLTDMEITSFDVDNIIGNHCDPPEYREMKCRLSL